MSREDIIAVALRLFALFLVVTAIRHAAGLLSLGRFEELTAVMLLGTATIMALTLAFAAVLWYFPLTIARKLLPSLRDSATPLSPAGHQVQEIAIVVLGLWVLASALPDTAYWLSLVMLTSGVGYEGFSWLPENKASITATAVEIVIGFVLVLGARGLSNLLYHLRYGNSLATPPEPGNGP